MEQFKYTIADKNYIQRPLVLGQINQLMAVVKGVVFPKDANATTLIALLGNRVHAALAIVLLKEDEVFGKSKQAIGDYMRDRDIKAIADDLEFCTEAETIMLVINDFFDCNPTQSLLEMFGKIKEKLILKVQQAKPGLIKSPSSSPEETLPDATPSSGDLPLPSADRT
ncbi:MAG: hypothetical protein M0R70_12600 [Nitrospirae bacterium]|nr:hypothetical protein [Nitrospirota bacterium]